MYRLERVIHSGHQKISGKYLTEHDISLCPQYAKIPFAFGHEFSKIAAIDALWEEICRNPESPQLKDVLRWYLTDRGLLFAQTRERSYPDIQHHWRRYLNEIPFYEQAEQDMGLCEDADQRMQYLAERAYQKRKRSFEGPYTYLNKEAMTAGFHIIFENIKVYRVSLEQVEIVGEEAGYCKGELSQLPEEEPISAYEAVMENWLAGVKLQFGTENKFAAETLLRAAIPCTTDLYEFLAYLLPDCIATESSYQCCRQRGLKYDAALAVEEEDDYTAQVERFRKENFTKWKAAYPVLEEYLAPEIQQFSGGEYLEPDRNAYEEPKYKKRLKSAFLEYLSHMESATKWHCDVAEKAADWFAEFVDKDGQAVFMQHPGVIFQVFRSPVYRYIYESDRNWNIERVLSYACVQAPLPITGQSLAEDRKLFLEIIGACDIYCQQAGMLFAKGAWEALWECIQQCAECLPFKARDLFCTRYHWKKFLNIRIEPGYKVLDYWLERRYTTTKNPKYIDLWRTLWKADLNPSRREQSELPEKIQAYKKLLVDPATELDDVEQLLAGVCGKIGWNKIRAGIDEEEREEAVSKFEIKRNSRKGVIKTICSLKGAGTVNISRLQLAEWLLLQCVCDETQRKLLECGYRVIKATGR